MLKYLKAIPISMESGSLIHFYESWGQFLIPAQTHMADARFAFLSCTPWHIS